MLSYKYHPKTFNELSYNPELTNILQNYSQYSNEQNHILFSGILHSGKRTRAYCYLYEIFGERIYHLKKEEIRIEQTNFYYYSSIYHFEISLNQELVDKTWIQQFLKTIIDTRSIFDNDKYVLITNAEKLNIHCQQILRRIMETTTCKFIFTTDSSNKMIKPILSRCICLRVANPSIQDIYSILYSILERENLLEQEESSLSIETILMDIIEKSGKYRMNRPDLMMSIFFLELYFWEGKYKERNIELLNILDAVRIKLESIVQNSSFQEIEKLRELSYEYWIHQIPFHTIIQYIIGYYIKIDKSGENEFRMNSTIEDRIQLIEIGNTYYENVIGNREYYMYDQFIWNIINWLYEIKKRTI
jgi:DNA polymerase III delta prime subunit